MASQRDCIDRWSLDFAALTSGTLPVQARFCIAHHARKCLHCRLQLLILLEAAEQLCGPGAQDVKAAAAIAGVDTKRMNDWLVAMYASNKALPSDRYLHNATPRALLAAFREYMADAQAHCDVLADAIRNRDLEGIQDLAGKAVHAWLGGQMNLRHLICSRPSTSARESERRLLDTSCMRITNLLALATRRMPTSLASHGLRHLRVQLTEMNQEPLASL